MKKELIIIVSVLITILTANAQENVNKGITIKGDNTGGSPYILFQTLGDRKKIGIQYWNDGLNFYRPGIINSGDGTLFIDYSSGKIGIGTLSPSSLLTLSTNSNGSLFAINGSYNNSPKIFEINQTNSDGMVFVRNALEQTISKVSGHKPVPTFFLSKVGIGSELPSAKLTIQTEDDGELFSIKGSYANNPKIFEVRQIASDGMVYVRNALGQTITQLSGYAPVPCYFKSNVGIGTTNPKYKLDVLGTIRTRELKVDMKGGADFVFENNYQLRPLEEVETFIKDNKHLPEIAPAKEMQKNGVNQSEMNQKLLQKIEELTLYVIDLKKELNELKREELNKKNVKNK